MSATLRIALMVPMTGGARISTAGNGLSATGNNFSITRNW